MGSLRFAVGDRVRCKTSAVSWEKGIINELQYRESDWPEGEVVPYQVLLDNGTLIFAPEDSDSLIRAEASFTGVQDVAAQVHVSVCQAGACRRAGAAAVLCEIEELVSSLSAATVEVRPSGCLGNCGQAPNVLVVAGQEQKLFAQVCDLAKSASVVERATGRMPSTDEPHMVARLAGSRRIRVRNQAREESKWSLALTGMTEDVANAKSAEDRAELVQEQASLLSAAGFLDRALEVLSEQLQLQQMSLDAIPQLRLLIAKAEVLGKAGRVDDIKELQCRVTQLKPSGAREANIQAQVIELLHRHQTEAFPAGQPLSIQDYAIWQLEGTTPVSRYSAIYHFRSTDERRGTPIARGRRKRIQWPKTWHTTLLAEVGTNGVNNQGPLPWIERDYTPISNAHDWEQGRCDILIKIYLEPDGIGTSWLHRLSSQHFGAVSPLESPARVWLSKPMRTMSVPSLSTENQYVNRKHSSVLLLVAGTGIVAVPQTLHHTQPTTCFDLSEPPPIAQPVSVIYSCRNDDALMIPELISWCQTSVLKRCTVLLTKPQGEASAFPDMHNDKCNILERFSGVSNASCVEARLSSDLLHAELVRMRAPLRVVVSGPDSFNGAAKSMLNDLGVEADAVTILSA